MAPSLNGIRILAEREETMKSSGAGLGVPRPPVLACMVKTQDVSELDDDMMAQVTLLANIVRGNFLDVQADAGTAVAGLTPDREFLFFYLGEQCLVCTGRTPYSMPSPCCFVPLLNRRQPCPVFLTVFRPTQ